MGIKSLSEIIKEHAPGVYEEVNINTYFGRRVGFDGSNLACTYWAVALKELVNTTEVGTEEINEGELAKALYKAFVDHAVRFLNNGSTPVYIFDGEIRPEKSATCQARRDKGKALDEQIDGIQQQLKQYDALSQPAGLVTQLRTKMRQSVYIKPEFREQLMNLLKQLGLPVIRAKHDAEQLGALLCREGHLAAFFSRDTDALTFGCPVVIRDINKARYEAGRKVMMCEVIRLDRLLDMLGLTQAEFVDMCIYAGCDFNVPPHGVGPVKCWSQFQQLGRNLDQLVALGYDISQLKHLRCREIFAIVPSSTYMKDESLDVVSPFTSEDVINQLNLLLDSYGLLHQSSVISALYKQLPKPVKQSHDRPETPRVRLRLIAQ